MTYEVFLYVDKRDVVLREKLSNACSVCVLVAGYFIAVENRRQACDIESNGVELARRLSKRRAQERQLEQKRTTHLVKVLDYTVLTALYFLPI